MKNRIRKFFKNPWTVTIGGGFVVLLLSTLIDYFTAAVIFTTIKSWFFTIWNGIISLLNFKIKVWWLLIAVGIIALGFFILLIVMGKKENTIQAPTFLEYKKDTIWGFSWEWDWVKDYYGKYDIDNLHPVCPICNTPLIPEKRGYGENMVCLRCNKTITRSMPNTEHIEMLIKDNVKKKYFSDR